MSTVVAQPAPTAPTYSMHPPKDPLSSPPLPTPPTSAIPASPATILPPRRPTDFASLGQFRELPDGSFLCRLCNKTWSRFAGLAMHLSVSFFLPSTPREGRKAGANFPRRRGIVRTTLISFPLQRAHPSTSIRRSRAHPVDNGPHAGSLEPRNPIPLPFPLLSLSWASSQLTCFATPSKPSPPPPGPNQFIAQFPT